jgi:hypothetical protein
LHKIPGVQRRERRWTWRMSSKIGKKKSPANKPIWRMSQLAMMEFAERRREFGTDFAAKGAG